MNDTTKDDTIVEAIIEMVGDGSGPTAAEMADALGVRVPEVSKILKALRETGQVKKTGNTRGAQYFLESKDYKKGPSK